MQPIRADHERELIRNPWTGQIRESAETVTHHALDDDGCIDSRKVTTRMANGCGCLAPAAGVCAQCGLCVCTRCFCHCSRCGKALCQAHSVAVDASRACLRCSRSSRRRRAALAFMRAIASPFVRFEKEAG